MPDATHVYAFADRPDVEVLVDSVWCQGELRGWWERDGVRLLNVQWRARPTETHIETVPADRVRLLED